MPEHFRVHPRIRCVFPRGDVRRHRSLVAAGKQHAHWKDDQPDETHRRVSVPYYRHLLSQFGRLHTLLIVTSGERTQVYSYSSFSESTGAPAAPAPLRLADPNIGPRAGTTGAKAANPKGCGTSSEIASMPPRKA